MAVGLLEVQRCTEHGMSCRAQRSSLSAWSAEWMGPSWTAFFLLIWATLTTETSLALSQIVRISDCLSSTHWPCFSLHCPWLPTGVSTVHCLILCSFIYLHGIFWAYLLYADEGGAMWVTTLCDNISPDSTSWTLQCDGLNMVCPLQNPSWGLVLRVPALRDVGAFGMWLGPFSKEQVNLQVRG